jgi:hypothetical protein
MKVVAYLSAIPNQQKNPHKVEILQRFIDGVCVQGDQGLLHTGTDIVDADVAMIQGWSHEHGKRSAHLQLREAVYHNQLRLGRRTLIVDSNLFNYSAPATPVTYHRYSFDGVFPTTGCYFDHTPDPARWLQISQRTGIVLKPWRRNGNHVLICTQRNGGWSMRGLGVMDWLTQTVKTLRRYTQRPIVVRGHPGDKQAPVYLTVRGSSWRVSRHSSILDDLNNAHAVITYNSSPGVAAAIEGIPVFVTDPEPQHSQALPVANVDLANIENPVMPDRDAWIQRLSMSHWSFDELSNGQCWAHIKTYV